MSVGGGVAVLEQRVKISLDSDYDSFKDTLLQDQATKGNSLTEIDNVANIETEIDSEHFSKAKKSTGLSLMKWEKPGNTEEKEKTSNTRNVSKKQRGKSRYNVSYHVSLNKALKETTNKSENIQSKS